MDLPCINEVVATSSTSWQWPVALNDFLQIQERCDQKPKEPPRLRFWRSVREGVVPNQSIKSIHFGVGDLACTIVVCEVQDIQLQPDTVVSRLQMSDLKAETLPLATYRSALLWGRGPGYCFGILVLQLSSDVCIGTDCFGPKVPLPAALSIRRFERSSERPRASIRSEARNTLLAAFLPKGSWQQMMLHFDEIGGRLSRTAVSYSALKVLRSWTEHDLTVLNFLYLLQCKCQRGLMLLR